jgi:hypothetical protein
MTLDSFDVRVLATQSFDDVAVVLAGLLQGGTRASPSR